MKDLIIVCAGGVGRETTLLVDEINKKEQQWNLIGYVDDNKNLQGQIINGKPVVGDIAWLNNYNNDIYIVVALGGPSMKEKVLNSINIRPNVHFATLIHPSAIICKDVQIGEDIIIEGLCFISTNIKIGSHIYIGPQCGIGHDSTIENNSSLYWNVNLSGNVKIKQNSQICTKTTILQGITIGKCTTVGAGAVVVRDLPDNCTAVGIPAKIIKNNTD